MLFDFETEIKGVGYFIIIKWKLFKTEINIYEKGSVRGCKTAEYKIVRASTIWDWLKYVAKKPLIVISCKLYYIYHRYILND